MLCVLLLVLMVYELSLQVLDLSILPFELQLQC
jgi:hypothetical protein